MSKIKKITQLKKPHQIHDAFFKEIFSNINNTRELIQLKLPTSLHNQFNWNTLKQEVNVFVDKEFREKRADLIFSVRAKSSKQITHFVFLIEHKSKLDHKTIVQVLEYQTRIYRKWPHRPVIPFIVYAGPGSYEWTGPRSFHEYLGLKDNKTLKPLNHHVLNFCPLVLNMRKDKALYLRNKKLTIAPVLHIMAHVWSLDYEKLCQVFKLGLILGREKRREVMESVVDFARRANPRVKWKVYVEAEAKIIKKKEDRIMTLVELTREELKQKALLQGIRKGEQLGIRKGWEEGREEGRTEVVLKMLTEKLDIKLISKITGYSVREIKKLKNNYGRLQNGK